MKMNEKLSFKNNKIYENIKINNFKSENEYEDCFSDLEPLYKRKLRKTKENNIKFNIKWNNKNFDKQVNKNSKIDNEKTKTSRKRKKEKLSIE